jgi:hypothetical protein
MVGDFNIKRFLTENKVTVASQRLAEFEMPTIYDKDGKEMGGLAASGSGIEPKMNELDVQDSQVTDSVKEFYELQQEMNTMKSRLKEMEARFKGFEGIIKPMLDEMKELGDKLAMAGEFVIKVNKFGGERMDASYKDAFENALSKVNAATKGVLQEALEASKKITQVKHSIDIQPANQLQEGIMDRISGAFKGFLSRLDQKVNNAAKAVEDFINLVADNVPGGEDVDDTPNPVLEGEGKPAIPPVPPVPGKDPLDKLNLKPVNSGVTNIATFAKTLYDFAQKLKSGEGQSFNPESDVNVKMAMTALRKAAKIPALPEVPVKEELTGNQDKLDKNGDGKISGDDFKMMQKEELGMRTKEVPNEHAGKYFVKATKSGENVKSGFDTMDAAIEWGRKNMRQAEWSVKKHKDTKRVYTKD